MECYSVSCENATGCALLTAFSFLPTVSKCFLRGMPWLCKYMPKPKNARLLIPDPEHEPDFYTLSRLFPLPHQAPDNIVPPSVLKKPLSSTPWGQSSSSSTTKFAFAQAPPVASGQTKTALQQPTISTAVLGAPYSTVVLQHPNVGLNSTLHADQLLLMQASALKEEQDRLYKKALQFAVLYGGLGRNNGRLSSGFP